MFYEEKVIEGILCYRTSTKGKWTKFEPVALTGKIDTLERRLNHSNEVKNELLEALNLLRDCNRIMAQDKDFDFDQTLTGIQVNKAIQKAM